MPKKKTKLQEFKEKAKDLALNGSQPKDPEFMEVQEMAQTYEQLLGEYKRNPTFKYLKGLVKKESNAYRIWQKCVENAKELEIDFTTYLRAQFYYSDLWGKRHPKPQECCSRKSEKCSLIRVKMYLEETDPSKKVLGSVKEYYIPQTVKEQDSARQMQAMMRNFQTDERGVFLHFGKQSILYFDRIWLKKNNTYNNLLERGEI